MSINSLKMQKKKLDPNTLLSFLTDIAMPDLDFMFEYDTTSTFYKGDIIHKFEDNKHKLFMCISDEPTTTTTIDNVDYWVQYSFGVGGTNNIINGGGGTFNGTRFATTLTLASPSTGFSFDKPLKNLNYNVITEVFNTEGDVGTILIKDKTVNGFKVEYTGIAPRVNLNLLIM